MDTFNTSKLKPYLSPLGAWALALGTTIGWGSLIVTCNTYLLQGGPIGSVIGLLIGAIIMIIISRNYHYMMNCYPDSGGTYSFTYNAFGHDYGFLTGWFVLLTYFAMLWANASSIPLFMRYFVGDTFMFGKLYTLFNYDVYLGEVLLTIVSIGLVLLLCAFKKKLVSILMISFGIMLTIAITFCFVISIFKIDISIEPLFVNDTSKLSQILLITIVSPWAFIGFENISHSTEEFKFNTKHAFKIFIVAIITATLLYIFVTLLSISAYPDRYASWNEYIADRNNLSGLEALPAFYAAHHYLGDAGVIILMVALLCLILTSLIGNIIALSRLFYHVSGDEIISKKFSTLNRYGVPWKTLIIIGVVSCIIPFFGRIAIGWVVDITSLGAIIIYGLVSASAYKTARLRNDKKEKIIGLLGIIVMILFGMYILLPDIFGSGLMEKESYFLFVIWSLIGVIYFHFVLNHDKKKRFGQSIAVWVAMVSLALYISLVWLNETNISFTSGALNVIKSHYEEVGVINASDDIIAKELTAIRRTNGINIAIVVLVFTTSLIALISNFRTLSKRAKKSELDLVLARDYASTDPLTGVKSKHAYSEIEHELDMKIHDGEDQFFAICVFDVNGLKYINDTFGHKAGDKHIKDACMVICKAFKHSPIYRVGGDEFVAILTGDDYDNKEHLYDEFVKINQANSDNDNGIIIACGISTYKKGQDFDYNTVFERADVMMYENKKKLKGARK